MSNKTADKRKKKKKVAKGSAGTKQPSGKNAVTLKSKLQNIYNQINIETTCCRQGVCCLVACPQMNHSEATQILDRVWSEWSIKDKKKLLIKSIEYYYSNSMVKACPLLGRCDDGSIGCRVYEDRPLNCRLYGQWPEEAYKTRVEGFKNATGFDKKDLPLNTQCRHVRRVDDSVELTEEILNGLFAQIEVIDMKVGKYSEEEIEKRHNYRTIHDWVMLKFFGDEKMTILTTFLEAAEKNEIEDFLDKMKREIENIQVL